MPKVISETDKNVTVDIRDDDDYDWIRLRRKLKGAKRGNQAPHGSKKTETKAS